MAIVPIIEKIELEVEVEKTADVSGGGLLTLVNASGGGLTGGVFECPVCFVTDTNAPTKFKCSNCTKKICDVCFARHILTKRNCVFCRSQLIIPESDLPTVQLLFTYHPPCFIRYKNTIFLILCTMTVWYITLLMYLFIGVITDPNDENIPDEKDDDN